MHVRQNFFVTPLYLSLLQMPGHKTPVTHTILLCSQTPTNNIVPVVGIFIFNSFHIPLGLPVVPEEYTV